MARAFAKRGVRIAGQAVVVAALVLGLVAFVGAYTSVQLTVDGRHSEVRVFGGTVGDALDQAGVTLAAGDEVLPDPATAVEDGTVIEVLRARDVAVTVDGTAQIVSTTGFTVADVLSDLRVSSYSAVSASLDAELAGLRTPLSISTPKSVTLVADGRSTVHSTTAPTVEDLLKEAKISLAGADRVSAPGRSAVVDSMVLTVTRVDSSEQAETEPMAFSSTEVEDPELYVGESVVLVAGVDGERRRVFLSTTLDGQESSRVLLREEVVREPVDEIVAVGTREHEAAPPVPEPAAPLPAAAAPARPVPAPVPAPAPPAPTPSEPVPASAPVPAAPVSSPAVPAPAGGVWAALAQCESGGNWSIDTGNGYYGGLQFSASSWLGAGGGAYAPYAHQATPDQQIAVAERLRASGGWGHWPSCAASLGLL